MNLKITVLALLIAFVAIGHVQFVFDSYFALGEEHSLMWHFSYYYSEGEVYSRAKVKIGIR